MVVNKVDRTKNDMVMDMPFVYVGSQDVFMLSLCYRVGKLLSDFVGEADSLMSQIADGTADPVGVFSIQNAAIGIVALILGSIPSPV